jgi:starvation-inducible DNA-binding protein
MALEKTKLALNQAVADLEKMVALVHQVHWYMRGPGFMKLHPKMDDLMDALNDTLDEMSERLNTIGGSPVSTLQEFDELSKIEMQPGTWDKSTEERIEELLTAYRYLSTMFQDGLNVSDDEGDDVTNGLFSDAKGDVEKTIWMLAAEIGQAPGL